MQQLTYVGQGHYRVMDALVFTGLTAPYRFLQLAPVSMLLGCLLALGGLARASELTAMRSLGLSEARIIGAVLKLSVPVILGLFLLAQFVIPAAQLLAQRQQAAAFGDAVALPGQGSVWISHGGQFLSVQRFEYGNLLRVIDIYDFSADGTMVDYIHADSAQIEPDGSWMLSAVIRKQAGATQFASAYLPSLSWRPFISNRQLRWLSLPPETMPPVALFKYVHGLRRMDQKAMHDEQVFWAMVAIPVALLGMVVASAPFVFRAGRAQSAGRQILIGMVFGISFQLIQQITLYLGFLSGLNPMLTALGPACLLLAAASWRLVR